MSTDRSRPSTLRGVVACRSRSIAILFALSCPLAASADTVATLLGNFTINQYCEVRLDPDKVAVGFVVVFGQLPALRELHAADTDRDGVTTQAERDAYVAKLAPEFAKDLLLTIDDVRVPLTAMRWTTSLPAEQSGFSLRLDIGYEGILPTASTPAPTLRFRNTNYADRLGWHEIAVHAADSIRIFDTDAFDNSLTNGLVDAVTALPASGPLDERVIHLRFGPPSAIPADARPIAARGQVPEQKERAASSSAADPTSSAWLQKQTKHLVDLISAPGVPLHVLLVALLASLVLGALHAFSPGHGKTIVGAYLIGSRSTPRHAVILGVTVTITHTLVVFLVGALTLFASHYILPERLFPILSLISGLLVLGMGIVLLRQRWPAAHQALGRALVRWFERRHHDDAPPVAVSLRPLPVHAGGGAMRYGMRAPGASKHGHGHDGHHHHSHGAAGTMHSHGGRMHSHMPPGAAGEKVTWRSLIALGVSGGLVPCPSAMVLLLAAIALNKTLYGLVLVVAFSVGLASTLIAVGMIFLYARGRMTRPMRFRNLVALLPAASGVFITLIGLFLCYAALTSAGLATFGG